MKSCITIIATCCLATMAWSEVVAVQSSPPATQSTPPPDKPMLIKMTVTAQAAPDPAMKYQLLPTLSEQTPGNAVLMYHMAQQVMPRAHDSTLAEERRDQVVKYLDLPLSELPRQEVSDFLGSYSGALRQIETGAMRKDVDWGLPLDDGVNMLFPPLGSFRDIARVLALKARLEIAEGQFDRAIHTIQVGMAMGQHVGEDNVLIGSLVGIAIDSLMLERVGELIDNGGPNMYWALAGLNVPLVDVRAAMAYERQWLMMSYPGFRKAMTGPIGPAEAGELLRALAELRSMSTGDSQPGGVLGQAALASKYYGPGKQALIERGHSRAEVDAMPVGQVVAMYLWADYVHWRDELFKWFELPYPQARQGLKRTQQQFQKWFATEGRYNPLIAMLPGLGRAYFLQAKLDRTKAALQTIEAVRAHAARHGCLPETLNQLELPAPTDPVTGTPFDYSMNGDTFVLVGPAPQDEAPREGVRYEVHVAPARPASAKAPSATPETLPAEGAWRGIDPFLQDGTIAVIRIDLAELISDAAWRQISTVAEEAKLDAEVLPMLAQARGMGEQYVNAGITEAFVVVNITDLPEAPMIVVPLRDGADADKLATMLPKPSDRAVVRRVDGAMVVATEGQLELLAQTGSAKRPRLMKALSSAKGAVRVGFAFSDAGRRALEETIGTFPPELGSLPGATLTRGLQWACLDLTVQPEMSLQLTIQSADSNSAQDMSRLINLAMEATADHIKARDTDPAVAEILESFIKTLRPSVSGDQLVLTLDQAKIISLLGESVAPAIQKARNMARRAASASNIRSLLIGFNMWACDHQDEFPPDLQTLAKASLVPPETLSSPLRPELGQAAYVYVRPAVQTSKLENPAEQVVLYEAHDHFGEGINVGFADGHVEWMTDEAQFQSLLKESQPASQPVPQ